MESTRHSDKKVEKSFSISIFLVRDLAVLKREISPPVGYKTAQEERMEIVRYDVNTRMPVSRFLSSSVFWCVLLRP